MKFCVNCGKCLEDNDKFCPYCGFKQENVETVLEDVKNENNEFDELYLDLSKVSPKPLKDPNKGFNIAILILIPFSLIFTSLLNYLMYQGSLEIVFISLLIQSPVAIITYVKTLSKKKINNGLKILSMIFISVIVGIFLFLRKEDYYN